VKTGFYISGVAHAFVIAWILFGGLFLFAEDAPTLENTQVSLLSADEFEAMSPPAVPAEVTEDVAAEEPPDELPADLNEVIEAPEPIFDDTTPIAPSVPDDIAEPIEVPLAPVTPEASPRPSPRVAPRPVVSETPDAAPDVIEQEATQPAEAPAEVQASEPVVEETTAPEEASDRIVAEADTPPSSAPEATRRPPARPALPQPTETAQDASESSTQNQDILAALAEATEAPAEQSVSRGPPLSQGEQDALRVSVSRCWNVGTLSSEALRTTVVVALEMEPTGKPNNSSLRMLSFSGGSAVAATSAYEAARRAIIRCGAEGFDLPAEKYDSWKEIEMTFDPEKMRNR
jgi:hypothetical protein